MLLAFAPAAFAYIGPGAGISLIGSLLSIIGAIFLAIFAALFWPIRRLIKRRKAAPEEANAEPSVVSEDTTEATDGNADA